MADTFVGTYKQGTREVLDYTIDWSRTMSEESDTAASSAWYIENSDSEIGDGTNGAVAPSLALNVATAWLVPGTEGQICHLTNVVTTSGGRKFEASLKITIVDK